MGFFRSCYLKLFGFLIISTALIIFALRTTTEDDFQNTTVSPDGKYLISIIRHPMLFAMPGQGSDAPATVNLYDAAGNKLNSIGIEMVQLVNINWSGERVQVSQFKGDWKLPKTNNINILLFSAAYRGNLAEVEKLIIRGADINFQNKIKQNLVHAAVIGNNKAIVQLFLQKGLDIKALDIEERTVLHQAVLRGDTKMIELLVASGVDINKADIRQLTPLVLAAQNGNISAIKALTNAGADVNYKSPLQDVLTRFKPGKAKQEMIELLLIKNATIHPHFLSFTIQHQDINAAKLLLERDANINHRNPYNNETFLLEVIRQNNIPLTLQQDFIKLFISQGIDINARNQDGKTALTIAEKTGKSEIVKLLKQHDARN